MKAKLALFLVFFALAACGIAQKLEAPDTPRTWSGSIYYDIRLENTAAVVLNKFGDLTARGRPTGFEVDGFVGVVNKAEAPSVVGFAALWRHNLFDQVEFLGGVAVSMTQGKVGGGLMAGLSVKF